MPPTRTELGKYDGDIVGAASPCARAARARRRPGCRDRARHVIARLGHLDGRRVVVHGVVVHGATNTSDIRETALVPERTRTYHRARPRCGAGARNAPNAFERDCIVKTVLGCDRAGSAELTCRKLANLSAFRSTSSDQTADCSSPTNTSSSRVDTTDAWVASAPSPGSPASRWPPRTPARATSRTRTTSRRRSLSTRPRFHTSPRRLRRLCTIRPRPPTRRRRLPRRPPPRWDPDPPRAAPPPCPPSYPRAAPRSAPIPSAPLRHVLARDATRGPLALDANKVQDYTSVAR